RRWGSKVVGITSSGFGSQKERDALWPVAGLTPLTPSDVDRTRVEHPAVGLSSARTRASADPMKSQSDRALIIIDMTPDKVSEVPGARDLIRYIRGELRYFRERGRPVIFACR